MDVHLRPEAVDDIYRAAQFFNNKSDGWGDHFVARIQEDLVALRTTAGSHGTRFGLGCAFSRKFPFAIYYRTEGGTAVVYAILSCRQSTGVQRSIIRGRSGPGND